jgi:hypothetical protein
VAAFEEMIGVPVRITMVPAPKPLYHAAPRAAQAPARVARKAAKPKVSRSSRV